MISTVFVVMFDEYRAVSTHLIVIEIWLCSQTCDGYSKALLLLTALSYESAPSGISHKNINFQFYNFTEKASQMCYAWKTKIALQINAKCAIQLSVSFLLHAIS